MSATMNDAMNETTPATIGETGARRVPVLTFPAFFLALALGLATAGSGAAEALRPLDRNTARQLADGARHARPTVLALWSTDCPHCKKNLALFARLAAEPRGPRLLTVAAEPAWAGIAEHLDRLGVPGERYAYGDEAPEALAHAIDPAWRGELPRTLVFDGRGGRRAVSGAIDEATLRQWLALPR